MDIDGVLREQIEYYRARAAEYDEWFLRLGRFDYGPEQNKVWFDEVATLERAVDAWRPPGSLLEIAGGTGWWTERLAAHGPVTVVDSSPEMIELNRQRTGGQPVEYELADVFEWQTPRRFDAIFFSFWLSHVPPERFPAFWDRIDGWLNDGGSVFLIDSLADPTSSARDHVLPQEGDHLMLRRLNDKREFRIYKLYYRAAQLSELLAPLGWRADLHESGRYFLYGSVRRAWAVGSRPPP